MIVWPKNDEMRKVLVHPSGNIAFREEGPADWPDDSFTHRRIEDGDVTIKEVHVDPVMKKATPAPSETKETGPAKR